MSWSEVPKTYVGGQGRAATVDQIRWYPNSGTCGLMTLSSKLVVAERVTLLMDTRGRVALQQRDNAGIKLIKPRPNSCLRQFPVRQAARSLLPDHKCALAWHREDDLIVIDGPLEPEA